MDEILSSILKEVPAVGAIIFIVVVFLKYVTSRDKAFNEAIEKRNELLEQMQSNCHTVQRETVSAVKENTLMLGKVSEALDHLNGRAH